MIERMKRGWQIYSDDQVMNLRHRMDSTFCPLYKCKDLSIYGFWIWNEKPNSGPHIEGDFQTRSRRMPMLQIFSRCKQSVGKVPLSEPGVPFPVVMPDSTLCWQAAAVSGLKRNVWRLLVYIRALLEDVISGLTLQTSAAKKLHSVGSLSFCGVASLN